MRRLIDTDVLVDLSRNDERAVEWVDRLRGDWALSAVTTLELISGAKNRREVELIDRLIEVYETIPLNDAIGRLAYDLLRTYAKSNGLRTFDSLIAATAIEHQRTLVTRNRKHFAMIEGLATEFPEY
jgi:tRNA(fMet)-specific endonuclease VapC